MPAPVRYRSIAAAYVGGGADNGTTRARGNRNAPPFTGTAARAIAARPPPPALPQ
ncbi:hypothetical protein [Streptomyces atratus]